MADTETAESKPPDAAPAPVFSDMFGGVDKETSKGLADIKRREIGETDRVMRGVENRLEGDREIARQHFDAAGVEAQNATLKPWNAKQEYDKVANSPLEAFGSFASVFAIAASAFTRTPMENALNASAAAMNAIHQGDEKAYERAHGAWKENIDLAQKRFGMQQTLYRDALDLMTHDQVAGRIKMEHAIKRFGDQHSLFLMERGMDKELLDLQTSRIKQFDAAIQAGDRLDESTYRRQSFQKLQSDFTQRNGRPPDANETVQQWNYAHGVKEPWQTQIIQDALMRNQGDPDIETKMVELARKITVRTPDGRSTEAERYISSRIPEIKAENPGVSHTDAERQARREFVEDRQAPLRPRTTEAERYINEHINEWLEANPEKTRREGERTLRQEFAADRSPGAKGVETQGRQDADWRKRKIAELMEASPDLKYTDAYKQATQEMNRNNAKLTGNRIEQLETHIDQFTQAEKLTGKVISVLDRYVGAAGVSGKVNRLGERLKDLVLPGKSGPTDRVQMMRDIEELQLMAPRLLLDQSTGRPLSAEAGHINSIVAGLSLGDTTANTLRAMNELKARLNEMKGEAVKRLNNKWVEPAAGPGGSSRAAPAGPRPWENDRVKE